MVTTFAELTFGWDIELKDMWSDRKKKDPRVWLWNSPGPVRAA